MTSEESGETVMTFCCTSAGATLMSHAAADFSMPVRSETCVQVYVCTSGFSWLELLENYQSMERRRRNELDTCVGLIGLNGAHLRMARHNQKTRSSMHGILKFSQQKENEAQTD